MGRTGARVGAGDHSLQGLRSRTPLTQGPETRLANGHPGGKAAPGRVWLARGHRQPICHRDAGRSVAVANRRVPGLDIQKLSFYGNCL